MPIPKCTVPNPDPMSWFALRVKSNCEKTVVAGMEGKGFEGFLPLYTRRQRWSDRIKSIESPLFPGYVFCHIDPARRLPVLTIPGAIQFVSIGRVPVPVDESEIAAIQTAMRSGLPAEPWKFLEVGEHVRIEEGPLAGVEGILSEARKQCRVVVSISLLQRSVAVEIDRRWLASAATNATGIPVTW